MSIYFELKKSHLTDECMYVPLGESNKGDHMNWFDW
jgi:hypothetical protein